MIRKTRQREVLEKMLVDQKVHYKPQDMLKIINASTDQNVSQATLYRTLADMETNGEIQSITLSDGCTIYDGNTMPHAHFYCRQCGTLMDIDSLPKEYLDKIRSSYGVTISKVDVVINGYCEQCAKERR